jgi:60 kDa SS-A/Ro ribonucleoprotein
MIAGRGGGYGFQVTDLERLKRFLILGHEGGTYYATQRTLTHESVDTIDRMLEADRGGRTVVDTIVDISRGGRAPKNDGAVFALAYVAAQRHKYPEAALYAMTKVTDVCRIGTHLFDFLNHCKNLRRGWGQSFKKGVGSFYARDPLALAKQVTKYGQRNGWSHRDVLRKCHFNTDDADLNQVLQYVTQNKKWFDAHMAGTAPVTEAAEYLSAVQEVQIDGISNSRICDLIREFRLPREVLPTASLNDIAVWDALLENMPLTAMIRNLGKMSAIGLIKPLSDATGKVVSALSDTESLKRQRVHPVTLLLAQKVYNRGCGVRGSLRWTADQQVVKALDDAFYAAFDNVEPTGKKLLLGVDVSGSMTSPCLGTEIISCREAAVVMAMLAARTEQQTFIHGFSTTFVDLNILATDSLDSAMRKTAGLPFAATRVALPIEFATQQNLEVDAFCVYTDNETNRGPHPSAALETYRQRTGRPAKFATFGFANSNFTVADPNDSGMMDFVGFDANAPTLLADFLTSGDAS